ncbi:MAG: DNA repair protein RadA [Spirochaetales bacterium]|nr:DNA repair protein RadA [Spirochaetales bacterium]
MARDKTQFLCKECGHTEPKWLGRCPSCGSWNSFTEFKPAKGSTRAAAVPTAPPRVQTLSAVTEPENVRIDSGFPEFNRLLGSGIMSGSSILIGGEPGIGKSTLLLQLTARVKTEGPVLYVSGEESAEQIKQRGRRLKIDLDRPLVLTAFRLEEILPALEEHKPSLIVIDSIQTLITDGAGEVPGTVSQLKLCCFELIKAAKDLGAVLFLVAHVTKEGAIAGPKAIEHLVDTVLYFEESGSDLRMLRAQKNRFGSTDELGLFRMAAEGLEEVRDTSGLFLVHRDGSPPAGTATATLYEGSRVLLVEIQALTVPAKGSLSRIYSDRLDQNRVSRIAAILEKHGGLRFSDQDIYINVARGLRITETGADLPLALALFSARTGLALPGNLLSLGELTLAGEIQPVSHMEKRIKAAADTGYSTMVLPPRKGQSTAPKKMTLQTVENVKNFGTLPWIKEEQ